MDLNQGYNQIKLAPESRYITTFSTHLGLRRFTRLNFGISSAAEIFQNVIRETLSGIQGVINISDDILVYGKTQKDHNKQGRRYWGCVEGCDTPKKIFKNREILGKLGENSGKLRENSVTIGNICGC